jgi:hypothetical protein
MRSRPLAALIGTLALGLLAAACGDGGDDAGSEIASLGTTTTLAPDGEADTANGESTGDDTADDDTADDGTADDDDGADDGDEAVDPADAAVDFARCMREHGVDMPDPEVTGDGGIGIAIGGPDGEEPPDREVLQEAQEACEPILEDAMPEGRRDLDPEEVERIREQALEFAECMREHGIDMPDPVFGDGGEVTVAIGSASVDDEDQSGDDGRGPRTGGVDPRSDEFQEAQEACGGPGGGIFSAGGGPGADGSGDSAESGAEDDE